MGSIQVEEVAWNLPLISAGVNTDNDLVFESQCKYIGQDCYDGYNYPRLPPSWINALGQIKR